MGKIAPGVEIDAYCGKCKLVRQHVVVAMKGTRAAKTECRTCNSVHAYRKNPPGTVKSSGSNLKEAARRRKYDAAMDGRDISKPIKYKLTQKFKEDDVLDHKKFGIGLVIRIVSANKMEVMFSDSTKLLVYSR